MRITHRLMNDNAVRYMSENLERLQTLTDRAASGKKFSRASDDPANATASLNLRSHLQTSQAYLDTVNMTDDWMSATDFSLRQMTDSATRAINLTMSGASSTLGTDERRALADEINIILSQAVGIGNTSHLDNYIFAGFRTTTRPFELVDADNNGIWEDVTYNGDAGVIQRYISPAQTITQNIDGAAAFDPFFHALIDARDALYADDITAVSTALASLQDSLGDLTSAMTINGARQRQVRAVGDRIEKSQIEIRSLLSQKEDVNMAEAISSLRLQETVYQSVLEVGHRAISAMSLFDILS